ncbi:Uncharacterised protein [Campylobacter jejuni]|nr:Uncharacterised protein [Campylobacter jejuni]
MISDNQIYIFFFTEFGCFKSSYSIIYCYY